MFSDHRFRPSLALSLCLLILGSVTLSRSAVAVELAVPAPVNIVGAPPAARDQSNDFQIIFNSATRDEQKYLTFGWNGWSGHTVHWRYNDNNRASNIVASASAAVDRIQAAMGKWSAVCNVQFVYDGSTTSAASLATNTRDGVNVIAWGALPGNTTAVTYAGASGLTATTLTIDEADMIVNYQYNPIIDSTLLHEVGHLLGLKHSNQEAAVMSGPNTAPDPSTAYTALIALQADDIAGCRSLYGASSTMPAAPLASASVSVLAFTDTLVGAASGGQSVTLSNTGNAPLAINYTLVSGNDFSLVSTTCNAGATVLPGASCVATTRFVPTATGARSGTMTIGHNATPAVTGVALSGNGLSAASTPRAIASLNVFSLVFPATTVGAVSPGTAITLSNSGNVVLALGSVSTSSREFQVVANNCAFGTGFLLPGARCTTLFAFAPSATGVAIGTALFTHGGDIGLTQVPISGTGIATPVGTPAMREMVEYRYVPLDYYFMTSRDSDKSTLDATSGFTRTGASFLVYAQQQIGMRGITRFYFDRVALGKTRGSHFYTLLDVDLLTLAYQNPTQSSAPGFAQNEGVDSYAFSPLVSGVGGSCTSGQLPAYRLFRSDARFPDNPNHRHTTSVAAYNTFVAQGWDGEGVNFCVPSN